jgi:hypothetical protein
MSRFGRVMHIDWPL